MNDALSRHHGRYDDFRWYLLANGGSQRPLLIGELPPALCRLLDCPDRRVFFDPGYAPKLRFKHRLSDKHFGIMPIALALGAAFQDKPGYLSFIYDDTHVFGASFYLVISTTGEKHELWVNSFRKMRESDKRRAFKRNTIIRPHI